MESIVTQNKIIPMHMQVLQGCERIGAFLKFRLTRLRKQNISRILSKKKLNIAKIYS